MRIRRLLPLSSIAALGALVLLLGAAAPSQPATDPTERLAAAEHRIAELEQRLATVAETAAVAKSAIARELSQPMLLLVGMGPCPSGFKRIATRVFILTRARSAENGHLWDEAGLPYEDPPGVGDNVYRDLDFCFRPANSVTLD